MQLWYRLLDETIVSADPDSVVYSAESAVVGAESVVSAVVAAKSADAAVVAADAADAL